MKNRYFIVAGLLSIALGVGFLTSCDNGSSGGDSGGGDGMGEITISSLPAGFKNGKIAHSSITGTHETLTDYKLIGGQWVSGNLDNTGSTTIEGTSVTVPVRGIKGGSSYEFTDGEYSVSLTVTGADNNSLNRRYTLNVTFSGSKGTVDYKP
jgi:hypothetical protein